MDRKISVEETERIAQLFESTLDLDPIHSPMARLNLEEDFSRDDQSRCPILHPEDFLPMLEEFRRYQVKFQKPSTKEAMNPTKPINDAPVEGTNEPSTNNQEVVDSSYNFGTASRRYNPVQPQPIGDSSLAELQRSIVPERADRPNASVLTIRHQEKMKRTDQSSPEYEGAGWVVDIMANNEVRVKLVDGPKEPTTIGRYQPQPIEDFSLAEVQRSVMPERADRPNASVLTIRHQKKMKRTAQSSPEYECAGWVVDIMANNEVRVKFMDGPEEQNSDPSPQKKMRYAIEESTSLGESSSQVISLAQNPNQETQSEALAPSAAPQMLPAPTPPSLPPPAPAAQPDAASNRWLELYDESVSRIIQHQDMLIRNIRDLSIEQRLLNSRSVPSSAQSSSSDFNRSQFLSLAQNPNQETQSEALAPSAAPQMLPAPTPPSLPPPAPAAQPDAASNRWLELYDESVSRIIQHQDMLIRNIRHLFVEGRLLDSPSEPSSAQSSSADFNSSQVLSFGQNPHQETQSEAPAPSAALQMPPSSTPPSLAPPAPAARPAAASNRWLELYDESVSRIIQNKDMLIRSIRDLSGEQLNIRSVTLPPLPPPTQSSSAGFNDQWQEEYAKFREYYEQCRLWAQIDSSSEAERQLDLFIDAACKSGLKLMDLRRYQK